MFLGRLCAHLWAASFVIAAALLHIRRLTVNSCVCANPRTVPPVDPWDCHHCSRHVRHLALRPSACFQRHSDRCSNHGGVHIGLYYGFAVGSVFHCARQVEAGDTTRQWHGNIQLRNHVQRPSGTQGMT